MVGVDPSGLSLREVWWLAVGAYDRDLLGRAFWLRALGGKPTPEEVEAMHPLRRAFGSGPTAEQVRDAAEFDRLLMAKGLANLNRKRG